MHRHKSSAAALCSQASIRSSRIHFSIKEDAVASMRNRAPATAHEKGTLQLFSDSSIVNRNIFNQSLHFTATADQKSIFFTLVTTHSSLSPLVQRAEPRQNLHLPASGAQVQHQQPRVRYTATCAVTLITSCTLHRQYVIYKCTSCIYTRVTCKQKSCSATEAPRMTSLIHSMTELFDNVHSFCEAPAE